MIRAAATVAIAILGCGRVAFDETADAQVCLGPQPQPDASLGPARFVAPSGGSDSNPGTETAPWATIAHALTAAGAGETIVLLDGLYTEALVVNVDGRSIRAATDGGAIFDGGGVMTPCFVTGSGITLEGVHCRNGMSSVVLIADASNVTVRRVTAHTAVGTYVFVVSGATDTLLEDVAAWGPASGDYVVSSSTRVTLRRCWARWDQSSDSYNSALSLADETSDSLVENCVIMSQAPYDMTQQTVGLNLFSADQRVDRNRILGNVIYGIPNWAAVVSTTVSRIEGNRFIDNAIMTSGGGFYQRSDADFGVERLTSVECVGAAFMLQAHAFEPKDTDFSIAGYVRDSVFGVAALGFDVYPEHLDSFTHTNNTLFALTQPYSGVIAADPSETIVDPLYDKARYGLGAYLIRNSLGTGAEVLTRYQDGVLTGEPLWPWPLEDRIARESGTSVTWESGGGIWRALPDSPCR